jgi:hypothetical protein
MLSNLLTRLRYIDLQTQQLDVLASNLSAKIGVLPTWIRHSKRAQTNNLFADLRLTLSLMNEARIRVYRNRDI